MVNLVCGEVQSGTELWRKQNLCPAAWAVHTEWAVGSWCMRNQRLYGHKPKGFPSHSWYLFQVFPDFELLTFVAAWTMIFAVLSGVSGPVKVCKIFLESCHRKQKLEWCSWGDAVVFCAAACDVRGRSWLLSPSWLIRSVRGAELVCGLCGYCWQ